MRDTPAVLCTLLIMSVLIILFIVSLPGAMEKNDKMNHLVTLKKEYQAGKEMAMREAACPWADNSCGGCHR